MLNLNLHPEEGILTFDIAVQSRVHLALNFPEMKKSEQLEIFKMFLKEIDPSEMEEGRIIDWLDCNFEDPGFNGRQIRNVLASAIDIARANNRKLKLTDIKELRDRTQGFLKSLKDHTSQQSNRNLAES